MEFAGGDRGGDGSACSMDDALRIPLFFRRGHDDIPRCYVPQGTANQEMGTREAIEIVSGD